MKNKRDVIKKTALVILLVTLFNIVIPYTSQASIGLSIITKPFSSYIMFNIDGINSLLSVIFAPDTKLKQLKTDISAAGVDASNTDGLFKKLSGFLDDCETAYYNLLLSPDDIFSNNIQILNANIFSEDFDVNGKINISDFNFFNNLMKVLKKTVAGVYYTMRNLAIVILLCLLIYCGIRIVIASSVANEKAKWKMYMLDWIKALALVMFVHLIMMGIFFISEVITNGIKSGVSSGQTIVAEIRNGFEDTSSLDDVGITVYIIMYIYVTYLTINFLVAYFKRLFYIMVMIVVAPIVSVLYAFGQTGKSTFNRWFKEFTMGVMVQPFHMLIYGLLVVMPINVMNNSGISVFSGSGSSGFYAVTYNTLDAKIYALLSISMIRPIEKYMRQVFQFGSTALDNAANIESGEKTIKAAEKKVVQTVKTVVAIGATVATGGAAAGAMAAGGAGTAATAATAGTAGTAGTAATAETAATASGEAVAGAAGEGAMNPTSLLGSDASLLDEASKINSEDLALKELENDFDNEDWTEDDLNAYQELYDEQQQRKANFENMKSQQTIEGSQENANSENMRGQQADGGPQELVLNNPNVTMNGNVEVDGVQNAELDGTENAELNGTENAELNGTNTAQIDNNENSKGALDGQDLSRALFGNLAGAYEGMTDKLFNPGMLEQYEKGRQLSHELADTLYITNDAPQNWKATNELRKEYIEGKKEAAINNFMNSPKNIEDAKKVFNLKDKVDKNTGEINSADKQAKEKLKELAPYATYGLNHVPTMKLLAEANVPPEKAGYTIRKMNREEGKYQQFVTNQNNIEQMQTIIADKMGKLAEFRGGDTIVNQEVNQEVSKVFSEGRQYIVSGAAKDPEMLERIVNLDRRISSSLNMGGSSTHSRSEFVGKADKIIQNAIQKNIKNIKLPGAESNKDVKALQDILNEVKNEMVNNEGSNNRGPNNGEANNGNS